jgi:hypothetical protein
LSLQLASNKNETKNDPEFKWLLCLSSTLQACRRLQVRGRGQLETFTATRPIPGMTKHSSNLKRLLFLTSELQASHLRQPREVREALRPQVFRMTKTENCLAESDLCSVLGPAMS